MTAPAVLVIGYGSSLRGDDGVGPAVAAVVDTWGRPGVRALAVHQLTPELAPLLAQARFAVFVDARPGTGGVRLARLEPRERGPSLGHASDPGALLALTGALHGRRPHAWTLAVPAARLGLAETLSPAARRGARTALRILDRLTRRLTAPRPAAALGLMDA